MRTTDRIKILIVLTLLLLPACNCGGPDDPDPQPPQIVDFSADPTDIMPTDSSLLSWQVLRAEKVMLFPDSVQLIPAAAGTLVVYPSGQTAFTIVATNRDGVDSAGVAITMSAVSPSIDQFYFSHSGVVAGDTTYLRWTSSLADSLVISGGTGSVGNPDSGSLMLLPTASRVDTAIAYNSFGADTMIAAVSVVVPTQIIQPQGKYHRGAMSSSSFDPPFSFTVADSNGVPVARQWVHLTLLAGDGQLSEDSIRTDSAGLVWPTYTFANNLGYATVLAEAAGLSSDTAKLRADLLLPGAQWQGQYVLSSDFYWDVVQLNGTPDTLGILRDSLGDPLAVWVANYESSLGMVILLDDRLPYFEANTYETVFYVIVNSIYSGKTPDSIGIGSFFGEISTAYGPPDAMVFNTDSIPFVWEVDYSSQGMFFWCNESDTSVFEMHLYDPQSGKAASYRQRLRSAATRTFVR